MSDKSIKIVGLIPAAGYAHRISPLPCSKEIYPIVGFEPNDEEVNKNPKVIAAYLLEKFKNAGLEDLYLVVRKGKWDIPQYLGTGSEFGLNIAYIVVDPTPGTPHSINEAFHFIKNKRILFGFPDILIKHKNPFQKLLTKLDNSGVDMVLGLFKTDKPEKGDMVETDRNGIVNNIIIKPDTSNLGYAWTIAVWDPVFTDFLHDFLFEQQALKNNGTEKELGIGHVIQQAIKNDIKVSSVKFPNSTFIDIGTIEDLKKALKAKI